LSAGSASSWSLPWSSFSPHAPLSSTYLSMGQKWLAVRVKESRLLSSCAKIHVAWNTTWRFWSPFFPFRSRNHFSVMYYYYYYFFYIFLRDWTLSRIPLQWGSRILQSDHLPSTFFISVSKLWNKVIS
jgi:hypothetical protein